MHRATTATSRTGPQSNSARTNHEMGTREGYHQWDPDPADNRPYIFVHFLGSQFVALVDTGSCGSYMSDRLYAACKQQQLQSVPPLEATVLDNQTLEIGEAFLVSLGIGPTTFNVTLHHIPELFYEVVLGIDVLQDHYFSLDLPTGQLFIGEELYPLHIDLGHAEDSSSISISAEQLARLKSGQRKRRVRRRIRLPDGRLVRKYMRE